MLEQTLRNDLKPKVKSVMAVIDPLKVIITNYEEGSTELLSIQNSSENKELGRRDVPFSKVVYIEKEDFMEEPTEDFKRLSPGIEVRLMGAYFIKCNEVIKDDSGNITELHCTYDPETKSGSNFKGRKVKSTIHWVSEKHAVSATVHLYDKLFVDDEIAKDPTKSWNEKINPLSKITMTLALVEPSLIDVKPEEKFQFYRLGYFTVDKNSKSDNLIFNRIVSLKDSKKNK
jgi:glutaminyl-tRNA synthetase